MNLLLEVEAKQVHQLKQYGTQMEVIAMFVEVDNVMPVQMVLEAGRTIIHLMILFLPEVLL